MVVIENVTWIDDNDDDDVDALDNHNPLDYDHGYYYCSPFGSYYSLDY